VDNSPSVDDVEPCEWTGGVYRQGLLYSNQESTPKSVLNNAQRVRGAAMKRLEC